jgi:flagellar basal-body rod protein FlgB
MHTSLDNYLGIQPQALSIETQRNELLAANLANVDTPNYKARDLDFKAALSAAGGNASSTAKPTAAISSSGTSTASPAATLTLSTANSSSTAPLGNGTSVGAGTNTYGSALKYRVPMAPSLDGNTVDEQLEQSAFAENTVRYQATLAVLSGKLKDLMTAITGS